MYWKRELTSSISSVFIPLKVDDDSFGKGGRGKGKGGMGKGGKGKGGRGKGKGGKGKGGKGKGGRGKGKGGHVKGGSGKGGHAKAGPGLGEVIVIKAKPVKGVKGGMSQDGVWLVERFSAGMVKAGKGGVGKKG
jgi:hypothetical protein